MKRLKKILLVLLVAVLACEIVPVSAAAASKNPTCKTLYKAAKTKVSSGAKKVVKKSKCTFLTSKYRKYADDFYYAADSKGIYCVCIVKADTTAHARKIKTQFSDTLKSNKKSNYYYSDSTAQKVISATQVGRSGKYVWYMAMSTSSKNNKNAVTALKKKL